MRTDYWGGNDVEAWYASTTYSAIDSWQYGYGSQTTRNFVDFGSANGCSSTGYGSGNGYTCSTGTPTGTNNSFTQGDYWYISYGDIEAQALPEIYYNVNG